MHRGVNMFPYNKCPDNGIPNVEQGRYCPEPSDSMKAAYVLVLFTIYIISFVSYSIVYQI